VFVQAAERFMSDTDSLKRGSYDAIVLDPPRTGIPDAVTEGVRRIAPIKIVYISCNPATLARDASRLISGGLYEIEHIFSYDMFPQTHHMESVCVLSRTPG
jgi:23S rRNA (uracil1939-C5)-methyltransferase